MKRILSEIPEVSQERERARERNDNSSISQFSAETHTPRTLYNDQVGNINDFIDGSKTKYINQYKTKLIELTEAYNSEKESNEAAQKKCEGRITLKRSEKEQIESALLVAKDTHQIDILTEDKI